MFEHAVKLARTGGSDMVAVISQDGMVSVRTWERHAAEIVAASDAAVVEEPEGGAAPGLDDPFLREVEADARDLMAAFIEDNPLAAPFEMGVFTDELDFSENAPAREVVEVHMTLGAKGGPNAGASDEFKFRRIGASSIAESDRRKIRTMVEGMLERLAEQWTESVDG